MGYVTWTQIRALGMCLGFRFVNFPKLVNGNPAKDSDSDTGGVKSMNVSENYLSLHKAKEYISEGKKRVITIRIKS